MFFPHTGLFRLCGFLLRRIVMKYDFTSILERHGKDAIAVDGLGTGFAPSAPKEGFDAIPMWVADMNFPVVPTIQQEVIARVQHPAFGYFDPSDEYYNAIIQWQARRNGVTGLEKQHIGYENGVLGGVLSALGAFAVPGDSVLLHSPTYVGFTRCIIDSGFHIVHSPLKKDENGVWRTEPYYSNGDSFYSRIADYKVAMQIPAKFALAHTGTRMSYDSGRAYETYYIAAPSVREFAFALIPNAATAEATARGGRVKVHALGQSKAHAAFGAQCVAKAIDFFSENIGEYPYSDIFVVPFDLNGGMEYPGLIMVNKAYFKSSKSTEGALVMGHETAHQWFYGVVGSDQVYSPWLDESLVEYLGFDFLRQYAGTDAADALERERYYAMRHEYSRTKRLDGSLEDLSGADYFFMVYAYGHDFYAKLVNEIGSGAFYEGLKTYYNANYMGIGTKEKLIAAFSEAAGRDLTEWFEANIAPEAAQ